MFCQKCGSDNVESDKFCKNCGNLLEKGINQTVHDNKKKNRTHWEIPVILFLIFFITSIINIILEEASYDSPILKSSINTIGLIALLCTLPSIIVVIVLRNKKSYFSSSSVAASFPQENQLLYTFIGNNYQSIASKRFSFAALFLSSLYLLYRKFYIQAILLIILIQIMIRINYTVGFALGVLLSITLGFKFNKLYCDYAVKKIEKIRKNNVDFDMQNKACAKIGGTNLIACLIIIVVLMIIQGILILN